MTITYEAGYDEPLHPDSTINAQMEEVDVSNCKYGCKVYGILSKPDFKVLGHSASYGCTRDRADILNGVSMT